MCKFKQNERKCQLKSYKKAYSDKISLVKNEMMKDEMYNAV